MFLLNHHSSSYSPTTHPFKRAGTAVPPTYFTRVPNSTTSTIIDYNRYTPLFSCLTSQMKQITNKAAIRVLPLTLCTLHRTLTPSLSGNDVGIIVCIQISHVSYIILLIFFMEENFFQFLIKPSQHTASTHKYPVSVIMNALNHNLLVNPQHDVPCRAIPWLQQKHRLLSLQGPARPSFCPVTGLDSTILNPHQQAGYVFQ